ncbi:MAG: type II toxin-antitoxin system HicA family toxin [Polyangiaceae bacterium]|nr:type II toxin-antitoxin system HicA family toxin [Polyangiaceae bacterium]
MGGLKRLSGDEVIRIFLLAGFVVHGQKGSHVKLRRIAGSETQTLTIPRHRELDTGTLRAIVRQAGRFLPDAWLKEHFFDA